MGRRYELATDVYTADLARLNRQLRTRENWELVGVWCRTQTLMINSVNIQTYNSKSFVIFLMIIQINIYCKWFAICNEKSMEFVASLKQFDVIDV